MKKLIIFPFFVLLNTAYANQTTFLLKQKLQWQKKTFIVAVRSELSRPNAKGKGFCGGGEEIILEVTQVKIKKPLFSKLVESCLETISLEPAEQANYGGETRESIQRLIHIDEKNIKIEWQMLKGEKKVTASLDLKSDQAVYLEK